MAHQRFRSTAVDPRRRPHRSIPRTPRLIAGAVLVVAALLLIWSARLSTTRSMYVSEMGAPGEPTAARLNAALLAVALAAVVIGSCVVRRHRGRPVLRIVSVSLLLYVGGASFALASQVTCTPGCPLPLGETFSVQDLVHTSAAVLGFAAACLAMLHTALSAADPLTRGLSWAAAIAVAVVALGGAALSLLRVTGPVGGWLELVATSIALAWLLALAVAALPRARGSARTRLGRASLIPIGGAPGIIASRPAR